MSLIPAFSGASKPQSFQEEPTSFDFSGAAAQGRNTMVRRFALIFSLCFLISGCATTRAPADRIEAMPLFDLRGQPFSLEETIGAHDATVLVFWATGCPCVARYQSRIDELAAFDPRVAVVAISSNADDDLETLQALYPMRSPQVPLAVDPGAKLAETLGARSTPMAVILDGSGRVKYRGWIDNERLPGAAGRTPWVEESLAAILSGDTTYQGDGPAWGCRITRALGEDTRCGAAH